jgi:hypothetical protein
MYATHFMSGLDATVLGIGLGLASLPKTLLISSSPLGAAYIGYWYGISNQGVNNIPSIHKH